MRATLVAIERASRLLLLRLDGWLLGIRRTRLRWCGLDVLSVATGRALTLVLCRWRRLQRGLNCLHGFDGHPTNGPCDFESLCDIVHILLQAVRRWKTCRVGNLVEVVRSNREFAAIWGQLRVLRAAVGKGEQDVITLDRICSLLERFRCVGIHLLALDKR